MSNNDLSRYSKRLVQYFWDAMPTNTDTAPIWCLGQQYPSEPDAADTQNEHELTDESTSTTANTTAQHAEDEALLKKWPVAFVEDIESRIWLTYRSDFENIPKSSDTAATSKLSAFTRLKQLGNTTGGFTSDTGWGCMIRSGQSLLANTLTIQRLGRDWRVGGAKSGAEEKILSLFADHPSAPFSIHRFVEHGAAACGKHPGEWFGPSATARCIQALTAAYSQSGLNVYVRPDDSDVYQDAFLKIARSSPEGTFTPTLILLGTRLGIDHITPVYWRSLSSVLEMPQSVGIAGGRPSSSHYFVGTQGSYLFYLDPHSTRPMLPLDPSLEDMATCHTRRLRRIAVAEMDPSMLLGFLIKTEEEWLDWRRRIEEMQNSEDGTNAKAIVHVHDETPAYSSDARDAPEGDAGSTGKQGRYATGGERAGALDEVMSCDESEDECAL